VRRRRELGQLDAQGAVELEQRGPARVGPGLVAVLGQQLAGVQVERGLVVGGLPGGARVDGGGLEGVDVDLGLEGDDAVAEAQGVGPDRPAGRVQGLVEVVGRGLGVAIGPQQVGQALAVHAPLGREGQELDQRLGLAQAPRALCDDAIPGGDREPAQQTHARCGFVHPGAPRWTSLLSARERDETGEDERPGPHLVGVQPRRRRICRPTRA
jgi:hypothetical protein